MSAAAPETRCEPKDKIIFALDVPTADQARSLVEELGDLISFYKLGLELLMAGGMETLLQELVKTKRVFVDLKLPGDIPTTVERTVNLASRAGVTFLTLSNSVTPDTIAAALRGRGGEAFPKLLYVSFLSSLDRVDFAEQYGKDPTEFESFLQRRSDAALDAGADGFIVSGKEIALLRKRYGKKVTLVSPGIRPSGIPTDDHKRSCTPSEAIQLGADFLVIGRPIRDAKNRRAAASAIIDELAGSKVG
jgi:orotidine-5'-phosphate decarboxylase